MPGTGDWKFPFFNRFSSPLTRLSLGTLPSNEKRNSTFDIFRRKYSNESPTGSLSPHPRSRTPNTPKYRMLLSHKAGPVTIENSADRKARRLPILPRQRSVSQSDSPHCRGRLTGGGSDLKRPFKWNREAGPGGTESTSTISRFAADLSTASSVSSLSFKDHSDSRGISVETSPTQASADLPLPEEPSDDEDDVESEHPGEGFDDNRKQAPSQMPIRPRVRLSERPSRVAVSPQHGGRFLDPMSMMGLVQRKQQICATGGRRSDELSSTASMHSGGSTGKSNMQSKTSNRRALGGLELDLDPQDSYVEMKRPQTAENCSHSTGRRSYYGSFLPNSSNSVRTAPLPSGGSEVNIVKDRRASFKGFMVEQTRRGGSHFRRRTRITESYTPNEEDVLWLAVRNQHVTRRRQPSKAKTEVFVDSSSLFIYETDTFGL
eukprot:Gregarina_sp_Poly_1__9224@NODE_569_length_7491_cov_137_215517_g446_i0_p2_GENE_NODE_569_length_7491_cov_137_215517_g446_i0NODE_569_length_7491_cov_137_215517_g446_i0_p2_ORF_typecomplete_len433_score65_10DUF4202/PF13875_6/0_038_NODE_569_length_7491_cov_137_215517_g446_i034244722